MFEFQKMLFMHSSDEVLVRGRVAASDWMWTHCHVALLVHFKVDLFVGPSVPQLATPTLQLLLSSISPHETAAAAG